MRAYKRRETGAYPFFKVATWDARNVSWKAGKTTFATESEARASANQKGRYRVERFDDGSSSVSESFDV